MNQFRAIAIVIHLRGCSRYSLPLTNQDMGSRVRNSSKIEPQVLEWRHLRIQHDIIIHQQVCHESLDLGYSKEATGAK